MAIKKTIAIVGATDKTGRAIVNQFASMPYRLLLVSNDLSELHQFTKKITKENPDAEIESLECVKDGCWEADVIIIAVAPAEEKHVAELMKEVSTQKIVVAVSDNENECEELEKVLPYSKVVKAYIKAEAQQIFIHGKSETVNEEILKIFKQAGYQSTVINDLHKHSINN